MRIIRTVQDLENAIVDTLTPAIDEMLAVRVARYMIYDEGEPTIVDEIARKVGIISLNKAKIEDFAETVSQLRDSKDILKVFVDILLKCRQYEQIVVFVNKLVVSHIGGVVYVSKKRDYRIEERYFDRYVEIIKYCNIPNEACSEFFMEIATCGDNSIMYPWKEPLREYAESIKGSDTDGIIYKEVEAVTQIEETETPYEQTKFEIFEQPVKVFVEKPKPAIAPKTVAVRKAFANKLEFEQEVHNTTELAQERMYGIRLKKYYQKYSIAPHSFEGVAMTYIVEQFKSMEDIELSQIKSLFSVVDKTLQNKIADIVYEVSQAREKLFKSKWAMRLISVMASSKTLDSIYPVLAEQMSKNKNAFNYFADCLVESGRNSFVKLYRLVNANKLTTKQRNFMDKCIDKLGKVNAINVEELYDQTVDDFGLNARGERVFDFGRRVLGIKVESNGEINYYNLKTGKSARVSEKVAFEDLNIKSYLTLLRKAILAQTKRFVQKFEYGMMYYQDNFDRIILGHNLLKILAEGVVWGKYISGELKEVFRVYNGKYVHISGQESVDGYKIGIVHPIELGESLGDIKEQITKPLFAQLDTKTFSKNEYPQGIKSIEGFFGISIKTNVFVNKLKHRGYGINNLNERFVYSQLVKPIHEVDTLVEIVINPVALNEEQYNTTQVSMIRLYKLSNIDNDNGDYVLSVQNALPIEKISPRLFSVIMSEISECLE